MVVSTRSTSRTERETRRDRYTYAPRQPVQFTHTVGYKYIDQYLEYDCLLTPEELNRLSDHKYSALDTSWLDELCMKVLWEKVVTYYPLWLAPNLITLIAITCVKIHLDAFVSYLGEKPRDYLGLVVNLITVLTLTYFCPTAKEVGPSWAYLLAALGLFIYQTLDATDGKQARRTMSASPLGELFDHGCDSISQVFVTLNIAYALKLGDVPCGAFFICVVAISLFYCAHWSTYCTGQLRFSRFDVTEAQMTVIGLLLTTALFGPGIWSIGVCGYQLRHLMLFGSLLASIYQGVGYLSVIINGGVGKNGSTEIIMIGHDKGPTFTVLFHIFSSSRYLVAGTSVLFPACPLMAVVIPFCMIYSKSNTVVFDENITLFALFFGAVAANSNLDHTRCAYILLRKNRQCRMLVKKGNLYCGEHAIHDENNLERIPCPNDSKHTVAKSELTQHLKRCNSRISLEPWIVEGINAIVAETKYDAKIDRRPSMDEIVSALAKIEKCFNMYKDSIKTDQRHCSIVEQYVKNHSELGDSSKKHIIQQSSIIGHMLDASLLTNDSSSYIVELGAGKAQLAYWMAKVAPNAQYLLVDRSGSRNKYDNKALHVGCFLIL
uniref:CHHC U11-48K-type domain-containing protein n=1 Tax=Heterorhabditis bacteriophora TaxID=37862 RepID=A0A1I7XKB5_HETBA